MLLFPQPQHHNSLQQSELHPLPIVIISVFYFIPTGIVIFWSPSKLGAGLCSILFLSEIVVGVITSSILTNEPFGWREITGSTLIVIGGILAVVLAPNNK